MFYQNGLSFPFLPKMEKDFLTRYFLLKHHAFFNNDLFFEKPMCVKRTGKNAANVVVKFH